MKAAVTHDVHGDRVLLTLEVPREAISAQDAATVAITMDDFDWRESARRVLRESKVALDAVDPEALLGRVGWALANAIEYCGATDDPEIARRRAVAAVLHRIADMVMAGTVTTFSVRWHGDSSIGVAVTVGRGDRRRSSEILLPIDTAAIAARRPR